MLNPQTNQQATTLNSLVNYIQANDNKITFQDFMQQALYEPTWGYYTGDNQIFGPEGDFITAPELGTCFATCLSQQILDLYKQEKIVNILELGAGSGKLCKDILTITADLDVPIASYKILEVSANLRYRQQETFSNLPPSLRAKIGWLYALPQNFSGIIIANEVLDAMPVKRFIYNRGKIEEIYVTTSNDKISYCTGPSTAQLQQAIHSNNIINYLQNIATPYHSEINTYISPWMKSLADTLSSGAIFIFDYGFPRHEFYHPDRDSGTLMCHHRHKSHSDPLINIGAQDITAHVDFTHVAEAAHAANLDICGYTNLASFLFNTNLLKTKITGMEHKAEILKLTSSAEMGELFKVMALGKNLKSPIMGFNKFDKSASL